MAQSESNRPIAAVLSTFRVLEEVAESQPVGVSEIARNTGMPKSTVQRCLFTLHHAGWLRVVDVDRARWAVTTKPLGIGLRAAGEAGLREAAEPFLAELRDITGETVHLNAREGDGLIVLARQDSTQPVRTYVELGSKAPMYTSSGISIMALLEDTKVETLIANALAALGPTPHLSRLQILEEVERARRRGYAVNAHSWWREEVSAVAAAVVGADERPLAAVAVSIPSSRFVDDKVEFWGTNVVATTEKISKALLTY